MLKHYVSQVSDFDCAPIAIVNACIFLGIRKPSLVRLSKEMGCSVNRGAILVGRYGYRQVSKRELGAWMTEVRDIDRFLDRGGIFATKGAKETGSCRLLHVCLCLLQDDHRYILVNAYSDSVVDVGVTKTRIKRMLPVHSDQWFFAFKKSFRKCNVHRPD